MGTLSCLAVIMKCFALFALASVALARPADEAAAVAPLVYGLPYGALAPPGYALPYAAPHVAYAGVPVAYNALHTGLVYPVAEAYVHDATGDVADDQVVLPAAYPYALPYAVYNPLASGLVYPVAEPYVHDASGDVAEEYVHDTAGDARKKRDADAQVLVAGALPYAYGLPYAYPVVAPFVAHPNGAVVPLEPADVVKARAEHLEAVAEALKA